MDTLLNKSLKTITAKVVGVDPSNNSIIVEYQSDRYSVLLNSFFKQSFKYIESIHNASDKLIYKDEMLVSLVNISINGNSIEFDESFQSYIVLEPNWLVNVTSLTQFDFYERSLFNNRFSNPSQNKYMLMGNIIHEVFEEIISGILKPKKTFFKSLNQKMKYSFMNKVFDFALLDLKISELEPIIRQHLNALYFYIKNNKGYYLNKEILTEHYMIDNRLGLKGKIDSVIMNEKNIMAIELKTGKSWNRKAKSGHAFQAQAYSMLLENKYKDKQVVAPILIYSGDSKFYDLKINQDVKLGMRVEYDYSSKSHVLNLRNRLISGDILFNYDYDNMMHLKCDKCFDYTSCHCVNNLENISKMNFSNLLIEDYKKLSEIEKGFFKRFNTYLTEESSTIKLQIGEFFEKNTDERILEGRCVEIDDIVSCDEKLLVVKCKNTSDLREKDMCLISDIDGPVLGECSQAIISSILEDSLHLKIRKTVKFAPKWIDSMSSDTIFDKNYPSIFNLLNDPNLNSLKNILINDGIAKDNQLASIDDFESSINLNEAQLSALQLAIGVQDFLLIQGPPGTGKTLTISKIVKQMYAQGKTVLLSCFTHRAIDELIKKINLHAPEVDFYRIGNHSFDSNNIDNINLKEESLDLEIDKIKDKIKRRPIYIGTTYAWLSGKYDNLIGKKLYDVAIIDEASQMILPNSIGVIRLASAFILVGDHLQQPPVIQSARAKDLSRTLFQTLFENEKLPQSTKVMLDTQHRMNPVIGSFISSTFYNDKLKNNDSLEFEKIYSDSESVSMVSKICEPDDVITLVHAENHSHALSVKSVEEDAEIILDLVEFLISKGVNPKDIGVIAPYRAQVALIRRKIESFISKMNMKISTKEMVDTIDRFQGDERDVIIFSMCLSEYIKSDLVKDKRKINVALSRAKKKLIVVGNWDLADKYTAFKSLFEYVKENKKSKFIRI